MTQANIINKDVFLSIAKYQAHQVNRLTRLNTWIPLWKLRFFSSSWYPESLAFDIALIRDFIFFFNSFVDDFLLTNSTWHRTVRFGQGLTWKYSTCLRWIRILVNKMILRWNSNLIRPVSWNDTVNGHNVYVYHSWNNKLKKISSRLSYSSILAELEKRGQIILSFKLSNWQVAEMFSKFFLIFFWALWNITFVKAQGVNFIHYSLNTNLNYNSIQFREKVWKIVLICI